MQYSVLYIIVAVLVVGLGILMYLILSLKKSQEKPNDDASMKIMMEWMKDMKQSTENTREGMQKSINETNS